MLSLSSINLLVVSVVVSLLCLIGSNDGNSNNNNHNQVLAQIANDPAAIGGDWGPLSVFPIATALAGMACGTFNGTSSAFVIGGIDSTSLATAQSFWYNFSTHSWQNLRFSGLPITSYSNVAILQDTVLDYKQKLFIVNGYSLETGFNRDAAVYDPVKRTWSSVTVFNAPASRRGAGSWFYKEKMYLFGGATENAFDNNIYVLNGIFTTFPYWSTTYFNNNNGGVNSSTFATAPTPRFGQCCAYVALSGNNYGYCFGGTTATGDSSEMWVLAMDVAPETWSLETVTGTKPTPRRDASCAFFATTQTFVVYGGFDSNVGGTMTDRTTYIYDINTRIWTTKTQPAVAAGGVPALSQAPMCAFGDEMLLVGGLNSAGKYEGAAHLANSTAQILVRVAPTLKDTPAERHFHNSIAIGDAIYIMFGADDIEAFNDVWEYNTTSQAWKQLTLTPADDNTPSQLPARFGATLTSTGTTLYVFGGATWPEFSPVKEMYVIELNSLQFRLVSQGTTIPVRLNHVMLQFGEQIVVGTGITTTLSYAVGWYSFDIQAQKWSRLTAVDEVRLRYGMSSAQVNDTHALIGLGYGSQSFFEWYFVSMPSSTTIKFSKQTPRLNLDSERRRLIRMFATAVVSGNQVFVCGGQIDATTPPSRATLCYHWNMNTNEIFPIFDLPIPVSGASANFVGKQMFVFGGRKLTSSQLLDEYSDTMQIYNFNVSKLCRAGQLNDTHCLYCGAGTVNPNCAPVDPGSYLPANAQNPVACPAGTFLSLEGASSLSFCLKCPVGSFSSAAGANSCSPCAAGFICPMGSTSPLGLSSGYAAYLTELKKSKNLTLQESNPPPYETPSLPLFPAGIILGVAVFLALCLGIFVGINRYVWRSRVNFYIPEDIHENLELLYLHYATHIAGMSESNFIEATHHHKAHQKNQQQNESNENNNDNNNNSSIKLKDFPMHHASAIDLQNLFKELDNTGSNALGFEGFVKAVILMIERGFMNPLENSEAVDNNNSNQQQERPTPKEFTTWVPAALRDVEMSNFDKFSDNHRSGQPGDEIRNQQTWAGGFLALFYYVAMVILVLAIVVNFVYGNIQESKSLVSRNVIQSAFGNNTIVAPETLSVRVAVVGPLHGKTISQLRDVCINTSSPLPNNKFACNSWTTVTVAGVEDPEKTHSFTCNFVTATDECEVLWTCRNCYIPRAATLLFEPSPYHSGDAVRAQVFATTGIRNPVVAWTGNLALTGGPLVPSWVERRLVPSDNRTVFTGSPPTVFGFGVTPTFVQANEVIHNVNPTVPFYLASGYHVRPNGSPTQGNQVKYDAFDRFHGVPIRVEIDADVTPLFVRRVFVQSSVQLIVSLLGAISGLGGGILAAVQFSDSFNVNKNSQTARDEELVEKEGVDALYTRLPEVTDDDVDDLLFLVEKGGYEANVAKELLDLINENCA